MTREAEDKILAELAELKGLVMQVLNPAASLDVKDKAALLRKAAAEKDPKVKREIIRQVNGGRR